ncbi:2'-5' RNA ligase family protein [Microbacterium sp. H1-D42]|uniref:2'-5' RNA ligase family protein n=1 Tax=Microbacterium sp. H1-D42 TaxID=2925844 RepID=UPI001F52D51F|nr:2'-5' RNA ligase family protein [Microbacterium sp. H1-D42]UNK71453.1 2'-5' RNA ligase family protein [Microbacterium sp. H1-D42]
MTSSVDLHFPELADIISPWWPGTHPVGVPPHITLLYPWVDPIDDAAMAAVTEVAAATDSFDVRFTSIHIFESGAIYLRPDPDAAINCLMRRLAHRFPETPLYGGAVVAPVPHLTVARTDSGEAARSLVTRIADALTPSLPLRVSITALSVMEEGRDGVWATVRKIPLRRPT